MKRTTVAERARAWVVDYSAARMQAIRWLGDRYLLARPINRASSMIAVKRVADPGK